MPQQFLGDSDRIQQIMLCLLGSACQCVRNDNSLVRVSTSHLVGPEEFLEVSVGFNGLYRAL